MTAIVVMAKAPRPGTVKTRLHPLLGPAGSAALQQALLEHTCTLAAASGLATFVAFDPPDAAAELAALVPPTVRLPAQRAGDLGTRMSAAVDAVAAARRGPVLVIGVDAPTLTPALLTRAAAALRAGTGVVLGPAADGGYYLIGLRRPTPAAFAIDPALWGGSSMLVATVEQLYRARADLRVLRLPVLRDLDTPDDAAALLTDPDLPPAIGAFLAGAGVSP